LVGRYRILMASFFGLALGEGDRAADGDGEDRAFDTQFAGVGEGTSPVTIFFAVDKNGFPSEPAAGAAVVRGDGAGVGWAQSKLSVASNIAPKRRSRFMLTLRGYMKGRGVCHAVTLSQP
jgi:hypothetical protein